MTNHIAIIGNSGINIGAAMAADLTLAGERIAFAVFDDQYDVLEAVRARGGIEMTGPAEQSLSRRQGLAEPHLVTADIGAAIEGAALIVLDVAAPEIEQRFKAVLPHLQNGQIVHVNTHGYWPSLRLAPSLRAADKQGVTLTEGITPTFAAGRDGACVTPHVLRRNVLTAVFPARRSEKTTPVLRRIFASLEMAQNVLHSNLASMNFLIHPGIALTNIGYFDRAEERGEPISFYGKGNTVHAAKLTLALDAERPAVCGKLGMPCRSVHEQIARIYEAEADDLRQLIARTPFYRDLPPLPASVWRNWMRSDVPFAHVPFVRLAEMLGCDVPVHRGFVDIMDAVTGENSWQSGLSLKQLGLAGLSAPQMVELVNQGSGS